MATHIPKPVTIVVTRDVSVSGILQCPPGAHACLVLAHGAGAGMEHPFMAAVANGLATLGIATLRYQFPYMEKRSKRPDTPVLCHATVRAAGAAARQFCPTLQLIAGGKSFGGRMTSQAQAETSLPDVCGLVFFGFPLHPPGQPSTARGEHLLQVNIPMLFLQGTRDAFAETPLIEPLVKRLKGRATLRLFEDADHSFHVPARTGRTDIQVRQEMLAAFADWTQSVRSPAGQKPR